MEVCVFNDMEGKYTVSITCLRNLQFYGKNLNQYDFYTLSNEEKAFKQHFNQNAMRFRENII